MNKKHLPGWSVLEFGKNIIYKLKPIFYWENNHLPKYVRQRGEIRNLFISQTSSIGVPMQKHWEVLMWEFSYWTI